MVEENWEQYRAKEDWEQYKVARPTDEWDKYRVLQPKPEVKEHELTGPEQSLETLKAIGTVIGPAETALNLATQIYGVPISGLAALAGLPYGKSGKWQEAVGKALIYEPQTKAGKYLTEAVSYPFTKVGELSEDVATKVTEATKSPELGTLAGTAVQTPLVLAGAKAITRPLKGAFPSLEKPIKGSLYQETVNRHWAIEDLTQRAKAKGVTIEPGENPALRARGYLGQELKVKSVLEDKTFRIKQDGTIEITGEGLKPILEYYDEVSSEKNKVIREGDLNKYRIARRTVEDLQRPKGDWTHEHIVTPEQVAEARTTVANLTTKYGNIRHLEETAKRLTDYEHRILYMLVDSGNLSEADYLRIVRANPNYAPFDRIMDNIEPEGSSRVGTGRKFTDARSPLKRIKGSERPIQNTIESTIKNTYRIMDVAERNTVVRNVAKLEQYFPDEIQSHAIEVYPIKVSPSEIDTITRTFRTQANQVLRETKKTGGVVTPEQARTGLSSPMQKLETIVIDALRARGMMEGEANTYLHKIKEAAKGKPEAVIGLTTTETIENTITNIIKETVGIIETPIESTIFRAKPYKPKGNIIEYYDNGKRRLMEVNDNLYKAMAGMNDVSSEIFLRIASFPARLLRGGVTSSPEFMARNFFRDQMDGFIQSKVGFKPGIDTIGAIANIIGKSDVYYDWLRSGAGHTTFTELSRDNLGRIVSSLTKNKKWYDNLNVINHARDISEVIETGTRLAIYKDGIKKGLSPIEAGFEAREGTVDFGVRGSSKELKSWSSMTAFFNPAIQGTDRFIRAHTQDPMGTFTKATASVTIPSVLLYLHNRNDPAYKELPRWDRDLFWHYKVGDTWVRLPKPFLFGAVYGAAPERFLEYLDTRDSKALDNFGRTILDAASPWSGDPASTFLVTGVKPLVENATNWNFFRERQIVPEHKKNWPEAEQYGKYTSEAAKVIGRALDYSPAKIENIIKGYTSYMGQYATDTIDLALKEIRDAEKKGISLKGKRPKELADYPVIRAFISRPAESQSETVNLFYRQSGELTGQYESYINALKNRDMESAQNIQKKYPRLVIGGQLTKIKQRMTEINKTIDLIIDDPKMDESQKRENIKRFEKQKIKIAEIGNAIIENKPIPVNWDQYRAK